MDERILDLLEKKLLELECEKDPFFNNEFKFVSKNKYIETLNLRLEKMEYDAKIMNSYIEAFGCDDSIDEHMNKVIKYKKLKNELLDDKSLTYISVKNDKNKLKIYKKYYGNLKESFLEYIKEKFPLSFNEVNLDIKLIDSFKDLDYFLENQINDIEDVAVIDEFILIKQYFESDFDDLIIEYKGVKRFKSDDNFSKGDVFRLIGELILENKLKKD